MSLSFPSLPLSLRKVGGMRFLRIGRLQVSWCICTGAPKRKAKRIKPSHVRRAYQVGYAHGERGFPRAIIL